jgi:hypothetical protein
VHLLRKVEGDEEASRAFLASSADTSSCAGVGSNNTTAHAGADGGSLSSTVAGYMATVSSQDPSAAHKALAAQALSILQRLER